MGLKFLALSDGEGSSVVVLSVLDCSLSGQLSCHLAAKGHLDASDKVLS